MQFSNIREAQCGRGHRAIFIQDVEDSACDTTGAILDMHVGSAIRKCDQDVQQRQSCTELPDSTTRTTQYPQQT